MGERRAGEERGKTSDLTRSREPATLAVEAMLPLLIRAAVVSGESVLCIGCRAVCTSVLCAPHHRRACAAPIHEAERPARAWRFCGPSTGRRLSRRAVRARACSALFLGTIRAVVPCAVLRRSTPGAQLGRTLWRRQRHALVAHKSRRLHSEEQPRPDEGASPSDMQHSTRPGAVGTSLPPSLPCSGASACSCSSPCCSGSSTWASAISAPYAGACRSRVIQRLPPFPLLPVPQFSPRFFKKMQIQRRHGRNWNVWCVGLFIECLVRGSPAGSGEWARVHTCACRGAPPRHGLACGVGCVTPRVVHSRWIYVRRHAPQDPPLWTLFS